ncbi:N-acetyltransferase family protein [Enterococcus sp. LJL98]
MIRPAKMADAPIIAQLILVILKDMEVEFLTAVGEEQTLAVLEEAVASPTYRYGYPRGIVKEIDGQVAGIAFGYLAADEPVIDRPLSDVLHRLGLPDQPIFVDLETYPEEWYLDSIVVAEAFRGQGVGGELLAAVEQTAKAAGAKKTGLCVDLANPKAQQLYERQGYEVVGTQVLSGHDYYHMQKQLG